MLDIRFIRENKELVKQNSKNRLSSVDIDQLLQIDAQKRQIETEIDGLLAQRNALSKSKPTPEQIAQVKEINEQVKIKEPKLKDLEIELKNIRLQVPNLTHKDVLVSDDEDNNPVLEQVGEIPQYDFEPKDHVELSIMHDLIDFDRATKVAGAKFYYLKNELALMEFAMIQYALDTVIKYGFTPFTTPDLAKTTVLEGLGFQPRGESTQVYSVQDTDLCLVGTAEITMGGYHMDEVLEEIELPKKYAAVSHCFRTEAGSYSKYAKGIFRVHQFTKIEMFAYCLPEQSESIHLQLLDIEKEIFKGLEIPFRIVDHCTADLGGPSIRTYDLEAWMPGKPSKDDKMGDWAEITSTSNCTDFQARGLNIKYKTKDNKKNFLHTLNGTAISICRALIALVEVHQQKDGTIKIPEVLQRYMGGRKFIGKK